MSQIVKEQEGTESVCTCWCLCSVQRQAIEGEGENSHANKGILSVPEAAWAATSLPSPPSFYTRLPLSQWIYYPLPLSAGLLNGLHLLNFMPRVNLVTLMVDAEPQWRGLALFISPWARERRHGNESGRAMQLWGGIIQAGNTNRIHLSSEMSQNHTEQPLDETVTAAKVWRKYYCLCEIKTDFQIKLRLGPCMLIKWWGEIWFNNAVKKKSTFNMRCMCRQTHLEEQPVLPLILKKSYYMFWDLQQRWKQRSHLLSNSTLALWLNCEKILL